MYARAVFAAFAPIALCSVIVSASPVAATPIDSGTTYQVLDHLDGQLATPYYALRLDGLSGVASEDFTFSAESGGAFLTILYDATADNLTIEGTVFGGQVMNHAYIEPQLWDLSFVYSDVTDLGGALDGVPDPEPARSQRSVTWVQASVDSARARRSTWSTRPTWQASRSCSNSDTEPLRTNSPAMAGSRMTPSTLAPPPRTGSSPSVALFPSRAPLC
jgi:hypothetical protein